MVFGFVFYCNSSVFIFIFFFFFVFFFFFFFFFFFGDILLFLFEVGFVNDGVVG